MRRATVHDLGRSLINGNYYVLWNQVAKVIGDGFDADYLRQTICSQPDPQLDVVPLEWGRDETNRLFEQVVNFHAASPLTAEVHRHQ